MSMAAGQSTRSASGFLLQSERASAIISVSVHYGNGFNMQDSLPRPDVLPLPLLRWLTAAHVRLIRRLL
jgi:hypothetical protein